MRSEGKFKLQADEIKPLIEPMGGCFATDHITVDGLPVGFMCREVPDFDSDSGWRFYSGKETEEYANDPDKIQLEALLAVFPTSLDQPVSRFSQNDNRGILRVVQEDGSILI